MAQNDIDVIKSKLDIVEIIGETVTLADCGSGVFKGAINPGSQSGQSLNVDRSLQVWHDWPSDAGGDIFNWIAYVENLDIVSGFSAILKIAAEKAGVTLSKNREHHMNSDLQIILKAAIQFYHDKLTTNHRAHIRQKWGLNDETIDKYQIGYAPASADGMKLWMALKEVFPADMIQSSGLVKKGAKGWQDAYQDRIVFPYWQEGQVVYSIARSMEEGTDKKYLKHLIKGGYQDYVDPSIKNTIFGQDSLKNADYCIITEGITDCLAVLQTDMPCISPVTTRFSKKDHAQIIELVKGLKTVYICNDAEVSGAGAKGADATAELLQAKGVDVRIVRLPREEGVDKVDLADFLRDNTIEDLKKLMSAALRTKNEAHIEEKYKDITPLSFDELKLVIDDNFPELWQPFKTTLSIMASHRIDDITNPFPLVLIGPPSCGKTTILSFYSGLNDFIYWSDSFTAAAFVSHSTNVKKEELEDIDLLPKIRHKTLITPELSSIFADRKEELTKTLGVLTAVLDGHGYKKDTGAHGSRGYEGDYYFNWLGASTPIQPHVWQVMGNLGPRLYFLNTDNGSKAEEDLVSQLLAADSYGDKVKRCQDATLRYLIGLWQKTPDKIIWDKSKEDINVVGVIAQLARLLSMLRGSVNIYHQKYADESGEDEYTFMAPIIEKPDRAAAMLYNLARGHALLSGRTTLEFTDLPPVIEVALSSAPLDRVDVFNKLLSDGSMIADDLANALNCSKRNALRAMKKLEILGLVGISSEGDEGDWGRPSKRMDISEGLAWFRGKDFQLIRSGKYKDTLRHENDSVSPETKRHDYDSVPSTDFKTPISSNCFFTKEVKNIKEDGMAQCHNVVQKSGDTPTQSQKDTMVALQSAVGVYERQIGCSLNSQNYKEFASRYVANSNRDYDQVLIDIQHGWKISNNGNCDTPLPEAYGDVVTIQAKHDIKELILPSGVKSSVVAGDILDVNKTLANILKKRNLAVEVPPGVTV